MIIINSVPPHRLLTDARLVEGRTRSV